MKQKERIIPKKKNKITVREIASFDKNNLRLEIVLPTVVVGDVKFFIQDGETKYGTEDYFFLYYEVQIEALGSSSKYLIRDILRDVTSKYPDYILDFIDMEFLEFDLKKMLG